MAVDLVPLMDHPAWKNTMSPAQRKQALDLWQDPATTDSDRAEMRAEMDRWQAQAAQEPSPAAQVVSSVGGMLQKLPGLLHDVTVAPFLRAGQEQGLLAPYAAAAAQTPEEREAAELPLEQQTERYTKGVTSLLAGPALGKTGYAAGGALLSKLAPHLPQSMQTAANALPAIGEAGGNYLARQANVAMGTEQPGMVGDVASVVPPLAVRGATSAPVARRLPGSAATQHEMAAEDIHAMTTRMQPATPADTLYRSVAQQQNPAIPAQPLRQTTQDIIARELREDPTTRNDVVLKLAQEVEDLATRHQDQIPMDVLYERMQRIGERLRGAQRTDDQGTRELSRLYAAFHDALESASQSHIPGAETLQQAIKASRQEHAVERLQRIVGDGRGITTQQGTGYTLVSGKKMLNEFERLLADDDVFRGSFTAEELADMRSVFEGSVKLPALPPPPSVQRGFGKAGLSGSVGGGIGYALGGPEGAQIGALAGVAAPEVISRLMMTGPGRQMLRAAFEGRDILTPQALAVLNQASRSLGEAYTSKRGD